MHDLNSRLIDFNMRKILKGKDITCESISVIIPVKDNQKGVDKFLTHFFKNHEENQFPKEIIIIDNASETPIYINSCFKKKNIPINIYLCTKPGASAARNMGAEKAQGLWFLFTDSDCIPTPSFISGYISLSPKKIAYAGNVHSFGSSYLDQFYDRIGILLPPKATYGSLTNIPMYLVTANTLIFSEAFRKVGGFNETYTSAGGEDEEFSMRLWQIGDIDYAFSSKVLHKYGGVKEFARRFFNYGYGSFLTEKNTNNNKRPHFRALRYVKTKFLILAVFKDILRLLGYYTAKVKRND